VSGGAFYLAAVAFRRHEYARLALAPALAPALALAPVTTVLPLPPALAVCLLFASSSLSPPPDRLRWAINHSKGNTRALTASPTAHRGAKADVKADVNTTPTPTPTAYPPSGSVGHARTASHYRSEP
jgi:hypothetical protein